MNPEILPEQKQQLATWASNRDALLLEISNLQSVRGGLEKVNKDLSDSNTDIVARMNEITGRIDELKKVEAELPTKISKEVADLQSQKTCMETEIVNLQKIVDVLVPQKNELESSIAFLTETFSSLNGRVSLLDKVIGHVTTISDKNAGIVESLVATVKNGLQEVVDVSSSLVKESNLVANELPKVFLEVKRQSLERQVINHKKI